MIRVNVSKAYSTIKGKTGHAFSFFYELESFFEDPFIITYIDDVNFLILMEYDTFKIHDYENDTEKDHL